MTLPTPTQLDAAAQALSDWVGDRREFPLADACRGIDQPHVGLGFPVTHRLVSTLLRKGGFRADGKHGAGYDRDTLYRRAA